MKKKLGNSFKSSYSRKKSPRSQERCFFGKFIDLAIKLCSQTTSLLNIIIKVVIIFCHLCAGNFYKMTILLNILPKKNDNTMAIKDPFTLTNIIIITTIFVTVM